MKKILTLLLISILVFSTMTPGFAESEVQVEKVVFKNLETTLKNLGLGGVRFYNEGTVIDSGEELSVGALEGETGSFLVMVSSTYDSLAMYSPPHLVDLSRLQEGNTSLWVAERGVKTGEVSIEFKTPAAVTDIEFIPQPSSNVTVTGITEPFILEVHTAGGSVLTKTIEPILDNNTVQSVSMADMVPDDMILDIQADSYELNAGDTLDVDVLIKNVSDIYAEDFEVVFNADAFELIDSRVANADQDKIYYKNESVGHARYIVASHGAINAINDDKALLTLTFKVKNYDGEAEISVLKGLVANSVGEEFETECLGKIFTLTGKILDVNGDEKFTLGDLAIASKLLGTDSSEWGTYTPDFDLNGAVESVDLSEIVAMILK